MGVFFHHLFRAIEGYIQKWTKENVPTGVRTLHDFGDGEGSVPAAPVDNSSIQNVVIHLAPITVGRTTASISNNVIGVTGLVTNSHRASIINTVLSMEAV
jgi:hypothetical protein